jgi:hypothetical protein
MEDYGKLKKTHLLNINKIKYFSSHFLDKFYYNSNASRL